MRAVVHDDYGAPEVLRIVDVEDPVPRPGVVIVDVVAVGLNPWDGKARARAMPMAPVPPCGIGTNFAGVVTAAGGAAYDDGIPVAVGDRVLGWGSETLRERVVVPADQLARKPEEVPWGIAGSLSTPGQTAVACLAVLPISREDTVLVTAAAGAVGFLQAQLAIARGASVVGTASRANHDRLRAAGVVPIEYGPGLASRLRRAEPNGFTAVFDNVGRDNVELALELGVPPGRICEIVDHAATVEFGLASPGRYQRRASVLQELVDEIAAGALLLPVQREFEIDRVAEAFALMETGHLQGKVVVRLRA